MENLKKLKWFLNLMDLQTLFTKKPDKHMLGNYGAIGARGAPWVHPCTHLT